MQDAGSQIAAAVAGDIRGRQVLDFCAGGGGKTLALAAAMANTGQLYAYDADARRLAETARRAQRAGVRSLQVRSPIDPAALAGLEGRMDLVFVDAPCTGSGTWRRHPDAKWRLTPQHLERRIAEQVAVLAGAAPFVKPGGRLIYVTCSLLAEENEDRVAAFVAATCRLRRGADRACRRRALGDARRLPAPDPALGGDRRLLRGRADAARGPVRRGHVRFSVRVIAGPGRFGNRFGNRRPLRLRPPHAGLRRAWRAVG